MLTALEQMPLEEISRRQARCQAILAQSLPEAGGLLVSSRLNIYYLTGTYAHGLLWLPRSGEAVLMVRRAESRARLESPLKHIASFKSYREVPGLCAEAGSPLAETFAVDKNAFSWTMSDLLRKHLPQAKFLGGDAVLRTARSVKSEWELKKIRLAGERHRVASEEVLPQRLHSGITELEAAHIINAAFAEQGSSLVLRMSAHQEENYGMLGVGEAALYPHYFDSPVGARGLHPAIPYLGDAGTVWKPGTLLTTDFSFNLEGYTTDKTQIFWAGKPETMPDEVRRVQDICIEIYDRVTGMLKPGAQPSAIWKEALDMAAKAGQADCYMGLKGNQVSFLGHGLGLCLDEFPVFAKGFDDPLETGMVVALEPKIAIPGIGLTGVENTFEITADGARCLTGSRTEIICVEQ